MAPFIPRPWAILCIILFPGILGFLGAAELSGVGICCFVPLNPTAIALPAFVALVTVLLSRWCDVNWVVAPIVCSLLLLLPIGISATSFAEEWPRLLIASPYVVATWVGARLLQRRLPLPKESDPAPVVS